jgi:signal transduction histidine kinase
VADWVNKKKVSAEWPQAIVVGAMHQHPWENWPIGIATESPILPLVTHFWQAGWFQLSLAAFCGLALIVSVWLMTQLSAQSKGQLLLHVERARIARDIHDDLGARLTELLLLGEVSQSELPEDSQTRAQISQICDKARGLSHTMDEVVWAVNSRRDTLRDFVNYVCKHAQFFLKSTPIRCRLDVEPEIPPVAFDLPVRRNLFLAVKEALNNAAKHSEADEVFLRIHRQEEKLIVVIEDNGKGFEPSIPSEERNGMVNMFQRMGEIGGLCRVDSQPGNGCRIEFTVPFNLISQSRWLKWLRNSPPADLGATKDAYPGSVGKISGPVKF